MKLHTFDNNVGVIDPNITYQRLVYPDPVFATNDTIQNSPALAKDVSEKRIWGTLLGEAKKAIERAISNGTHQGLFATLQGFASASSTSIPASISDDAQQLRNPDVVKGKGRPTNKVAPEAGKRPRPRQYQPLQPDDVFQENEIIDLDINTRHDVLRIEHATANALDVLPHAKVPRNE